MRLQIQNNHLAKIVKMAERFRVEICGLLIGKGGVSVYEVRFITNLLHLPMESKMEPLEMVEGIDEAEERGLEVVGIFHSHPKCPPKLSGRDLRGMELWPVVWLIISSDGETRAWILKGNEIEEVKIANLKVTRGMFGKSTTEEFNGLRVEVHDQRTFGAVTRY